MIQRTSANEEVLTRCFSQLSSASAKVRILTDSDKLRNASRDLQRATISLSPGTKDEERNKAQVAYFQATGKFETLATADANSPVVSPFLIRLAALVLVEVVLFGLFVYWRRLARRWLAGQP